MRYVVNKAQSITDIADAIRAKTGSSEEMSVDDMPDEIASITGGKMTHIEQILLPGNVITINAGMIVTIENYVEGGS